MDRAPRLVAQAVNGDPFTAYTRFGDYIITGSAMGRIKIWDTRLNLQPVTLAERCEEGIRGITVLESRVYCTVGDLYVLHWTLDPVPTESSAEGSATRIDFNRPHNSTVCDLSFTVQSKDRILLLTQGQGYSHLLNLETGSQEALSTFGCPWHTVPCDLEGTRLLWRELLNGPGSCVSHGKTGDLKRLKVWSLDSPANARLLRQVTLPASGGFRLWGDNLTAFQGREIALFSIASGKKISSLVGHKVGVQSIDFLGDNVVSLGKDRTIKTWSDGRCATTSSIPNKCYSFYSADMASVQFGSVDEALVSTGTAVYSVALTPT